MNRYREHVASITKLASDWDAVWDRGDVEGVMALYGDNTVLMSQSRPAIVGNDAIRSAYQSVFNEYVIKGNGTVVEVELYGDPGYLWSHYTLTAIPKAGRLATTSTGKSIFILTRQADGSRKIARLIDNSDAEM